MTRIYKANNPEAKGNQGNTFRVEWPLTAVLGVIARGTGDHSLEFDDQNHKQGITAHPSTRFRMSGVESSGQAHAIGLLGDDRIEELYLKVVTAGLFTGTFSSFKNLIKRWQEFLETCDGYNEISCKCGAWMEEKMEDEIARRNLLWCPCCGTIAIGEDGEETEWQTPMETQDHREDTEGEGA